MSRKIKNIVMLILLMAIGVAGYFTINYASENMNTNDNQSNLGSDMSGPPDMNSGSQPPDMNSDNSSNSDSNSSQSDKSNPPSMNNNGSEPPAKPSGDNSGTPPEKPSGDNSNTSDNNNGDNNNSESNQNSQDNNSTNDNNTNQPPDMNGNMVNQTSNQDSSNMIYYILFGVESFAFSLILIYLVMSNLNKKEAKETFSSKDKITIFILSSILMASVFTALDIYASNHMNNNTAVEKQTYANASGKIVVTSEETLNDDYSSTTSDESAILVKDGGNLALNDAKVSKTGDSSNTENSEFYGVNAGILVQEKSQATIKNTEISTDAIGANAVFSTGEDSKIYISDSKITTTGSSSSRGLDATYSGYIEADNVEITTQGNSSATLATDRGEGTVIAKNSTLETNGQGSPVIYSTGDIEISKTTGTANNSQMVVIEGKNSAVVNASDLIATGKGNRNDVDQAGVMIYQSMSGDASEGTGTFTAKNSKLTIDSKSDYYKSAPMFFITNTDAVINLENTTLKYGSNILISAKGTSEWGEEGNNGGNLTLNATNQTLKGNIEIDDISSLIMNLEKSSYKGTINSDNNAKSITLKLDSSSKITLTGDSYVSSLEDSDTSYSNIDFNGYTLYVNGKAIN